MTLDDALLQQVMDSTVAKPDGGNALNLIQWLARTGISSYPWWSPARDTYLRNFWKQSDHLSGAVYTICSKISAIPIHIEAVDNTNVKQVREAEIETDRLLATAELGEGWQAWVEKFVEDLVTVDNGAFSEIIGEGEPGGPIVGRPLSVRQLDSSRCQRTGDPEYPVIYRHTDGKLYKLHYTRVMLRSQMTSPIAEMYGVGFCAISRALNVAQNLVDILMYKQEKLGSRPYRGIMVTGGGLDPSDVREAFSIVAQEMDSQGLSRYSKIAVVGSSSMPDANISLTDVAGLPDNFDERTSVELGIATIAMAFGMDARELFPALASGATRADALIQHLKQRGKGPGQIIQMIELMFNQKYLPPYLKLVFDYQDDEQDRQAAEVKQIRAQGRSASLKAGEIDVRTARQQMKQVGDLSDGQFNYLELQDGRLPDGTNAIGLFSASNKDVKKLLKIEGLEDPLSMEAVPAEAIKLIQRRLVEIEGIIIDAKKGKERDAAEYAAAALRALLKEYEKLNFVPSEQEGQEGQEQEGQGQDSSPKRDPRIRRVSPTKIGREEFDDDELEPDNDEERVKEEVVGMPQIPFWERLTDLISGK